MSDMGLEERTGVIEDPEDVLSLEHSDGSIPEGPLNARRGSDPPGPRPAVMYARHSGLASCSRGPARVASTVECDNVGDMGGVR
jgi:hypothetical protein